MHFYSKNEIEEIFLRFHAHNPEPKGELYFHNNFTLLIAVLLSAQSTDKAVNIATQSLFKIADNAVTMNKLSLTEIEQEIKMLGLWRNKAKNIKLLCQQLLKSYNGKVPNKLEDLINLAGVGRKTANVVLNVAFSQDTLAVDTHIFRIANRTKLAPANSVEEVERKLVKIIPRRFLKNAHIWLILHGRYICKAKSPLCYMCFINDICKADCNNYRKISLTC